VGPVKTTADKRFVYNNRFTVVTGGKFFVDGEIKFPEHPDVELDKRYRTCFGPCVSHDGAVNCVCNHCQSRMMRRMTAIREPDEIGLDQRLCANQLVFFANLDEDLEELKQLASVAFTYYFGINAELEERHADPHQKRLLRIQAYKDLVSTGDIGMRLWMREKHVKDGRRPVLVFKQKPDEIIKQSSYPRAIGDFGCPASLQGILLTYALKIGLTKDWIVDGGTIRFTASPALAKLDDIFERLISPDGRFFAVVFSDDSSLAIRHNNEIHYYNIDIKKCDGSHGPAVFAALGRLVPCEFADEYAVLIEQLSQCIVVSDVYERRNKVILDPNGPVLWSGSTLTTDINTFVNKILMRHIARRYNPELRSIEDIAAEVGYLVSVERCALPERLQFLKHSPCKDTTGKWRPFLNLGVLFRLSGTCRGDLPGRGSLEERGRDFQASLLQGAYPYSHCRLLDNMRAAAGVVRPEWTEQVKREIGWKVVEEGYPEYFIPSENLYRRYGLTVDEMVEVDDVFGKLGHEMHYCCAAMDRILTLDYELKIRTEYDDFGLWR